jgi:hypothetical protein
MPRARAQESPLFIHLPLLLHLRLPFIVPFQAIKQLRDQMVANDYSGLLHGIERLIPVGLNNRLAKQYRSVLSLL